MKTDPQSTDLIWEAEDEPPPKLELDAFLNDLFKQLDMPKPEVDILVTDDVRMRDLNRRYRNRDKTTDVLSFPSGLPVQQEPRHLGDIVISAPKARAQAVEIGHDMDKELRFLVLHGVLHLLGYDHETDDGQMLALQSDLKQKLATWFAN